MKKIKIKNKFIGDNYPIFFITVPKILEYRNCNISKIKQSIELLKKN